MERLLHQDEIDSLFRTARGEQPGPPPRRQRQLEPCDFRKAGQITREQSRAVSGLVERFARNLGHSLGAYLRTRLELSLVSIEQLGFGEFMQRMPEISYVASLTVMPIGASSALQLDLELAYPMIDLVLGGNGAAGEPGREVTEIEEQILEGIVTVVMRELQQVWQPVLDLSFAFEQRQPTAQIFRLMPPGEKIMTLSFEVHLGEKRGMMNMVFPAVVSTGLLRRLSEARVSYRRQDAAETRPRVHKQLLGARFDLELVLPPSPLAIRDLIDLRIGQVLTFTHPAHRLAEVKIAGLTAFAAQAIRRAHHRAALIKTTHALTRPDGDMA
ncbi:MAG TPA: FliM/FliN family flagellar motor switch protein [Terriglobales bacterium]|jgi:flagellar motor switch protein FliM